MAAKKRIFALQSNRPCVVWLLLLLFAAGVTLPNGRKVHLLATTTTAFQFAPGHRSQHALGSALASSSPGSGGGEFGELTSALATLDQQWQIQQRSGGSPDKPRWSKLMLPKIDDEHGESAEFPANNNDEDFVWMLEPPNGSIPSCVITFTGGAGLGQFPQVAYNELLSEISTKLNAVCLTAPYEVGLDHFSLAKSTGERLRRALLRLEEQRSDQNPSSSKLPAYSLAHSLGCKLQTIYLAAMTGLETSFDGVGFLAYNNFSFARTISMARSFAQELRSGGAGSNNIGNPEMINNLFDLAEMAVGAIGVEFSPTPQDTDRLIQLRYNENLQAKTRVFCFGSDSLDSSPEFRAACDSFGGSGGEGEAMEQKKPFQPTVSRLEGGHLTPVFFRWDADDLAQEGGFSEENWNMAREAMGGFRGASFGDEVAFGALVTEVCDWILGKPPAAAPRLSGRSDRHAE